MSVIADLRYAVRSLGKRPAFCALAILTLSLGTAGAAGLYSFISSWVIRPMPAIDVSRTLFLQTLQAPAGKSHRVSYADFRAWQKDNKSFSAMALYATERFTLQSETEPEIVAGVAATSDLLPLVGAQMEIGRGFRPSEEVYGAHHSVIVSHGFWKSRFDGSPDALGKTINLDAETYTVIGVLKEKFHFPIVGRANVWIPLAVRPAEAEKRNARFYDALALLRPGITVEQARQDLSGISATLAKSFPDSNQDFGPDVMTLGAELGKHTGADKMMLLLGVAIGLMLIACSNVGNLLLVRAFGRRREAAIQLSLGASRARMISQALAESLLLFSASAALSIVLGKSLMDWVSTAIPASSRGYLPNYGVATLDWTVFAVVLGFSLLCGIAFGVGPALEGIRVDLASMLKDGGASASAGTRHGRMRSAMVVGQILLATLLLIVTGELIQSFRNLWARDPGFIEENLLSFRVSLDAKQYGTPLARAQFVEKSLATLATLPQAGAPAAARFIPFGQEGGGSSIRVEGRGEQTERKAPIAGFNSVSPAFFATMRNPVLAGRTFEDRDSATAPSVVMINDAVARELFADRNPIGQRLILGRFKDRVAEIVGVVKEMQDRPDLPPGRWQIYVPQAQAPSTEICFVIRAQSDPIALAPAVRRLLAAVDRTAPVHDIMPIPERSDDQFTPYRILCQMLVGFGVLALIMAAVGVYGVISFATTQRTKEFGVRVALGADRKAIVNLVLHRGIFLVLAGLVPGIALAFLASRLIQSIMPEVQRLDPVFYVGTSLGLALVGTVAALVPAIRAARVDPLTALRM